MEQLTGVVLQAALSILSVLLMTAVQKFKKWLEAKAGYEGVKTVEIVANNAVRAVEQMSKDIDIKGEAKYREALMIAKDVLTSHGLNIGENQLKMLIESAVKSMNDGWNGSDDTK